MPTSAYDNLYAELTRGVSHAQVRHHLITEYRAAILREAADVVAGPHPDDCGCGGCADCATHRAARQLRRMADEETR